MDFSDHSQAAVMDFLNSVAGAYPSAISLAAGRPTDLLFKDLDVTKLGVAIKTFLARQDDSVRPSIQKLLQYGRTEGIVNDLVCRQLENDDGVSAECDRLLITSGCQEALALCIAALCPSPSDFLLVLNPTYVGATGAARSAGVAMYGLQEENCRLHESIERAAIELERSGNKARAVYLIPDFDNPTGRTLDKSERLAILDVCERWRIVILEDNPYGLFRYEGERVPALAALDKNGIVIYLTTYSKVLSPAVRVGAASLPKYFFGDPVATKKLFTELVQRKSFISLNTSQLSQAIVGGILIEQSCSLKQWIEPALELYHTNRDIMLDALKENFSESPEEFRWNKPLGGFFLTFDVPFEFGQDEVQRCAADAGVLVVPMRFFALDGSQDNRIRLAFSAVNSAEIRDGIFRLKNFIQQQKIRSGQ
ncbi:PLP-dependent aminotransferase family protein [Agrobacterium rhizogenes]|nr:PLP-dependent aminotransferase family protein [Rhizobium rhizogenes]